MGPPCKHNPPHLPPDGEIWTDAYCHLCHLYATSEVHRKLFDAWPPPEIPPKQPIHPLACVHLGTVVERYTGICRRRDIRICGSGHGNVNQIDHCETCGDYESEES